VVRVSDALSNPVAAIPVMFRLLDGGGGLSESVVSTDASGEATTTLTVEGDAIPPHIEASVTALEQPLMFTITGIVNDDIRQIEVSGNNQVAAPGETLLEPLVVRVENSFDNNPIPGVEVAATIIQGAAEFVTPVSTMAVARSLMLRQTQTGGGTTAVAVTDANGEARFLLRVLDSQDDIVTQVTIANQTIEFTTFPEVRECDPLARPMTIFVRNIINNCEINPLLNDDLFQFTGTAGNTSVLTLTRVSGGLVQAELFGPDQQRLATFGPTSSEASQRLLLPQTGLYTLRVTEFLNDETVTYRLALASLFPPPPEATIVALGDILEATIDPILDSDVYLFAGTAGNTSVLTLTRVSGGLVQAELFGPDQQRLTTFGPTSSEASQRLPLPQTGLYTLRVTEFLNDQTVTYRLTLDSLFPQ
jgi:hypothetical protein